jgi:glyoxylase-like metal-dependent hydrolase (beta-lactamase superfamily II)
MTGVAPRRDGLGNPGCTGRAATRSGWFAHEPCADGLTRIWEPFVSELLQANMFLVEDAGEQLLIDAGLGIVPLRDPLAMLLDESTPLLLTHSHRDHVGGAHEFNERLAHAWESEQLESPLRGALRRADMAPRYVTLLEQAGYAVPDCLLTEVPDGFDVSAHVIPAAPATQRLDEGDVVHVGGRRFDVLVVPGHTPGSLALFEERTGLLLAGDLLYDGPLIDFLPESDPVGYRDSLGRVLELPLATVCGGHGPPMSAQRAGKVAKTYLAGAPAR